MAQPALISVEIELDSGNLAIDYAPEATLGDLRSDVIAELGLPPARGKQLALFVASGAPLTAGEDVLLATLSECLPTWPPVTRKACPACPLMCSTFHTHVVHVSLLHVQVALPKAR